MGIFTKFYTRFADMGKIKQILDVLWQLPQFVLGWAVGLYYRIGSDFIVSKFNGVKVLYSMRMGKGVAFGNLIVLPYKYRLLRDVNAYVERVHFHELGHCRQSRKLGWLYLLIIGLPSALWNILHEVVGQYKGWDYYAFYTERWANELGGIED